MGPVVVVEPEKVVEPHVNVQGAADPTELRAQLRALVNLDPALAARDLPVRVAAAVWEGARGELVERGVRLADLRAAARGYRRELWLWVMGERTWAQTESALAGRAERRAA